MSYRRRFDESPLHQKWRPGLQSSKRQGARAHSRRRDDSGDYDSSLELNEQMNDDSSTSVLQRAIMYQLEQKLPRLENKKKAATSIDSNTMVRKSSRGSLKMTSEENAVKPRKKTKKQKFQKSKLEIPRTIMSSFPDVPDLQALTKVARSNSKTISEGRRRDKQTPLSKDSVLDQLDSFVEIDPKYASPFAPEKAKQYTVKKQRVSLHSFDADRAALDEYASLMNKCIVAFGGFGIGREKSGDSRSGWRSIWETSVMYTNSTAIPRESIEMTEGCNYFHGDMYSMSLQRRPKWSKMRSSVAKKRRMEAALVAGDESILPRSGHSTLLIKGSYMFIFGGKQRGAAAGSTGGDPMPLNDVRYVDLRSRPRVWNTADVFGCIPSRRWGHRACLVGSKMFVVGGIAGGTPFSKWNPYLDVTHNSSVPKRRNPANKTTSPPSVRKSSLLFPNQTGKKEVKNMSPTLLACLDTDSMEWNVPTVVSHDMPRSKIISGNRYVKHAKPPYALYGHSMTKMEAWTGNDGLEGLVLFGGWEWLCDNIYGEKVIGPVLSDKVSLYHTSSETLSTVATWVVVDVMSPHKSPGPRANHTAVAHEAGIFIFGGRCLVGGEITAGKQTRKTKSPKKKKRGQDPHAEMILVDLQYLNDLCLLVRERTIPNMDGSESESGCDRLRWVHVNVNGKLPRPRESASMVNIPGRSMLMYGGYAGEPGSQPVFDEPELNKLPGAEPHPWLNDFFVLRVEACDNEYEATWTQVLAPGAPCPRCDLSLFVVDMARADPEKCIISGPGLHDSFVGETCQFFISTFDETGESRWCGRDSFQVLLEGPWPEHVLIEDEKGVTRVQTKRADDSVLKSINAILAHVIDHDNGTYTCEYSPLLAGYYSIEIRCNGGTVSGSPYAMWSKAGKPVPLRSTIKTINGVLVEPENSSCTIVAGEDLFVDISLFDRFGNERHEDADAEHLSIIAISLASDPDSTNKDTTFWEGISSKSLEQIQKKFNEMWVSRVGEMASGCLDHVNIVNDPMGRCISMMIANGRGFPPGVASFNEGLSSKKALSKFFDVTSDDIESSKINSGESGLGMINKTITIREYLKRGIQVGNDYAVVTIHMKIRTHNTPTYTSHTGTHTTSCCPRITILYHFHFMDSHSVFVGTCTETGLMQLQRMNQNLLIKGGLWANKTLGDGPPLSTGSCLQSIDKLQYKSQICAPPIKGPCLVAVLLDGQHICGSPIQAECTSGHVSSSRSYVKNDQQQRRCVVGDREYIEIVAVDSSGLPSLVAEDCFKIKVSPSGNTDPVACTQMPVAYQGGGIYNAAVSVQAVGDWLVQVMCRDYSGKYIELAGSPVELKYTPGKVCASKCMMKNIKTRASFENDLSQLTSSTWQQKRKARKGVLADDFVMKLSTSTAVATVLQAGEECKFSVCTRDQFGNATHPEGNLLVKLVSSDKLTVIRGHVTKSSDDSNYEYNVMFVAQRATLYEAHITFGHDHILGSPLDVVVYPHFCDYKSTEIVGTSVVHDSGPLMTLKNDASGTFNVIVRDKFKNRTTLDKGLQLTAIMTWPSVLTPDSHEEHCEVLYLKDGEYKCKYGSERSGEFVLNVLLGEHEIVNSPLFGKIIPERGNPTASEILRYNEKDDKNTVGTKLSWTILEKDSKGNRRANSSLELIASLKMVHWENDPFALREKLLISHKEKWERNKGNQEARKAEKEMRRRKRNDDLALVKTKRAENFEAHVDRAIDEQIASAVQSTLNASIIAIEEGNVAYKDLKAPTDWLVKLYSTSYTHVLPPVTEYSVPSGETFGVQIEDEVSDDDVENVDGSSNYTVPHELTIPIVAEVSAQVETSGNGIHYMSVLVPHEMIGEGEISVAERSSGELVSGSPFSVKLSNEIISGTSIAVEPIASFDRFAGIPIVVNIVGSELSHPTLRSLLRASIIPLPKTSKDLDNGCSDLEKKDIVPTLGLESVQSALPPPDGGGLLAGPTQLSIKFLDSGIAQIEHTTATRGNFQIEVRINNMHIKGSPFEISVLGGKANARRTAVSGPGAQSAVVNKPSTFNVFVCDQYGNKRTRGGDKITGKCTPSSASLLHSQIANQEKGTVEIEVTDYGDGSYVCSYQPKVAGPNFLQLQCNGDDIRQEPISIEVKPGGLDASKCTVQVVPTTKENEGDTSVSSYALTEQSNVTGLAGYAMRILIASRDMFGNMRRGKQCLEDGELFQLRVNRADKVNMREPTIQITPIYDSNGMDTGYFQGLLILETIGQYLLDASVSEYTVTRLGRYGLLRQVTQKPILITVNPGLCFPKASTLTRLNDNGEVEIMYNNEQDTCDAYARISRKDALKAGTAGATGSSRALWYGPFLKARASVDIRYHGVYMRSRQQLQDQIVSNLVRSGVPSPQPVFLLLVGGLGSGKAHVMQALNRFGRVPLEAFVWIDTQLITLQIPETKLLLNDPNKKSLVFKKTSKEAGFLAEIAIQEAMSCKKSVAYSTSLASGEWCREWMIKLKDNHPDFNFVALHIMSTEEDALDRAHIVEAKTGLHISDDTICKTLEQSANEFESLATMDLWTYTATIENKYETFNGKGPIIIDEGGTQAFSTRVAPSVIGDEDMEAADVEQRAELPMKRLSGVRGMKAPLLSPKRAVRIEDVEGAKEWKRFCIQFENMYESVRMIRDHYTSKPYIKIARSVHIPRLMITAGERSSFSITTRDAYGNLCIGGDEEIEVSIVKTPTITEGEGVSSVKPVPEEGRYICTYESNVSGNYALNVVCKGQHICNSPFSVTVLPSAVDYSMCVTEGPAFEFDLLPSAETWFTITAKDTFGNRITRGGDKFSVTCMIESDDNSVMGKVIDKGDGRYEVKLLVPDNWSGPFKIYVEGMNGEHVNNSPFDVVASTANVSMQNCFFEEVLCAKTPPQAGTLLRLPFTLPRSGLKSKVSMSILPFTGVQSKVQEKDLPYVIEEESPAKYVILFRLLRFDPSARFQIHLSCFGSRIKPLDSVGLLPTLSAAETDPKHCHVCSTRPDCKGLEYAAGGQENKFRIQVHDRFGNLKTAAGDQFRALVISPMVEDVSYSYVGNGVYEFKYNLPFLCGAFAHSNRAAENSVQISIELLDKRATNYVKGSFDALSGSWTHIANSPFEVPVALPMNEKLCVVNALDCKAVRSARFRIWEGHGGHGDHILAGRVGSDGGILVGDARQWDAGAYTIEIEAKHFFSCRYRLFVPRADVASQHIMDEEYSLLASRIPQDAPIDTAGIEAPQFETITTKDEIPTLRVLKQGEIDVEETGLKMEHIWWFAKKGDEVGAVMNEDGTLTELTLAMCEEAFGKNPAPGIKLPSSYSQYLKLMREYSKAYEAMDEALNDTIEDITMRSATVPELIPINLPSSLALPLVARMQYSTCLVLRWSSRSTFIPTWLVDGESNNFESGLVRKNHGTECCVDTIAFDQGVGVKSLSVVLTNEVAHPLAAFRQTLASVHIYQYGSLTDILHVSTIADADPTCNQWKIIQFDSQNEDSAIVNILSKKVPDLSPVEKPAVLVSENVSRNVLEKASEEEDELYTYSAGECDQDDDEEYGDDDFEMDEYGDDEWEE